MATGNDEVRLRSSRAAPPSPSPSDRWKDTLLMPQEELKVYVEGGFIALKQIAANGEEALIYITPGNVPAVVARLLELYQHSVE